MITSHPLSCCYSGLNRLHLDLHLSLTSLFSPRQPEGTREHLSQVLLLPTHSPPGLPTHSPRVKAQVPSTPRDPEWPVCPTPPTHLRLRALTSPFPPPRSSCSSHMGLLPAPPTYQVRSCPSLLLRMLPPPGTSSPRRSHSSLRQLIQASVETSLSGRLSSATVLQSHPQPPVFVCSGSPSTSCITD